MSGANTAGQIPLWPKGAPCEKGDIGEERDVTKPDSNKPSGKRVLRLGNVSVPTIAIFHPAKSKNTGAAVVVCPGGGYSHLGMDLEGTEVCQLLNSIGVTGVLLKYRVPKRPGDDQHILPLQDAQRALGLVRFHAKEWNIDPGRIGSFSAGGHLTANLCNNFDKRAYGPVDAADAVTSRPDFALPMYPAYLALKDKKGRHCSLAHIGRSRRLFSNIWQPICRVANKAPDALPSRRTVLSAFQNLPSRRAVASLATYGVYPMARRCGLVFNGGKRVSITL